MTKDNIYKYSAMIIIAMVLLTMGIFLSFSSSKRNNSSAQTNQITSKEDKNVKSKNEETKNSEETTIEETTVEETTVPYKKLINFKADYPFIIKVNLARQWVCVYGLDHEGHYSVPYKIFICSTGRYEGGTPKGAYSITDKYDWRLMVDNSYAQYAVRFNGPIMFHSVPYYSAHKDDLEVEEYNKLGTPASLGCVRMNVTSVKWIYDKCPVGTKVIVYSMKNEKAPLDLPVLKKAKSKGKLKGWDPTDPDENNPWLKKNERESSMEGGH